MNKVLKLERARKRLKMLFNKHRIPSLSSALNENGAEGQRGVDARSLAATRRIHKDLDDISKSRTICPNSSVRVNLPNGMMDPSEVEITIMPTAGPYSDGQFRLSILLGSQFPFKAPIVRSITPVWHPNITLEDGIVKLGILQRDWTPVLTIDVLLNALQIMFLEPDPEFSANEYCTALMVRDVNSFKEGVRLTMNGGLYFNINFPDHRLGKGGASLKRPLSPSSVADFCPSSKRVCTSTRDRKRLSSSEYGFSSNPGDFDDEECIEDGGGKRRKIDNNKTHSRPFDGFSP